MQLTLARGTAAALLAGLLAFAAPASAQFQNPTPAPTNTQTAPGATDPTPATSVPGPVRLRQAPQELAPPATGIAAQKPAKPGEFETFVQLPRFGADLVNELAAGAGDFNPVVPPDYVIQSGDEVQFTLWGSVDADIQVVVDRSGRIVLPRVGPVQVAGTRYADLAETISRRVAQVFKGFQLSASMGRLRGVRVFVTGYVERPGAYAVAGLSTITNAVMRAGGPSAAGSFREIQLKRGGKVVAVLDLYDLLIRGERGGDRTLQPDDVIHVVPVGSQVAITGSVNRAAIFELKPGETVQDVLRWAGGFTPVADRVRLSLERLDERNGRRVAELRLPESQNMALVNGDVLRAFSAVNASLSVQFQNKRIRVEGEVARPGEYVLPPDSTLQDAILAAGGLTPQAYLYGADFSRESVRQTQQINYDRALRDLETDFTRAGSAQKLNSAEEAAAQSAQATATSRLIERLRSLRPTGRIVLQVPPGATELPTLTLEDSDRLYVPPRPNTVGVFGSVFNGGSYLYRPDRNVDGYLRLAGGSTKGADAESTFVVKANGIVASARQEGGRWFSGDGFSSMAVEAGDTIFVPEEVNKTTFVQAAKDWTQILYQFGLGIAGIRSITR
jgi:protein involved in polysaccharide export with SLBB domain